MSGGHDLPTMQNVVATLFTHSKQNGKSLVTQELKSVAIICIHLAPRLPIFVPTHTLPMNSVISYLPAYSVIPRPLDAETAQKISIVGATETFSGDHFMIHIMFCKTFILK